MGNGLEFRCNKCGYAENAIFGVGFLFPEAYQSTVASIKAGEFGEDWKTLFESIPRAAVNAEMEFYVCPACGMGANEPNLSVYEPENPAISKVHNEAFSVGNPATGMEYVVPWELGENYRLVKTYIHKCPECGKRMHKYRMNDRLICPK